MKNLYFLGDSLIEYHDWQARFPTHRVKNFGYAGETVAGLLARLPGILKQPEPDEVFLMIGTNNMVMEDYSFLGDYGEMIERIQAAYPNCRIT